MSSRRGIILVLALIAVAIVVSIGAVVVLAVAAGAPPSVPANATLHLKIEAPFSEIAPNDLLGQFMRRPPTLRATVDAIHKAKADTRVKALVIRPSVSGALWAQVEEVRAALDDYRTSGKPLVAFLESGGAGEYYLSSGADRVVMMPAGQLDLAGVASYEVFFRGALDKIGVFPDLLHEGDFKSASNTFTERGFTPQHREMTRAINRDWFEALVRAIARGRGISEDAARQAIDGGPYLAEEALAAGLVDVLAYDDQLDDAEPLLGTQSLDADRYARVTVRTQPPGIGGRIAVLYAVGTIASGKSRFDSPTGQVVGSETFSEWLRAVRTDSSVDAVVVRIDSPGGSAIASEVIWRELMLTRDVKPVVVSMGDVAASGGYYIAAPAHTILAQPGTLTGSIGVVTGKFVLRGALDKLGIATDSVSDGRLAEMYSPFRPFTPDERARVEAQMRAIYDLFLTRVTDGRGRPRAAIEDAAQGRVWTGFQAKERGLIDDFGGLDDAIRIAKERAKLDPQKGVGLVVYPAKRSLYDVLQNPFGASAIEELGLLLRGPGADAVESLEPASAVLRLFRRGEPLAIMPNVFVN